MKKGGILVAVIETGVEPEKRKERELFSLAERFRTAADPEEVRKLGDRMGRMMFGDRAVTGLPAGCSENQ